MPDRFAVGMRHRRTWARRADGKEVCLAISSAPICWRHAASASARAASPWT